jgi:hypothetical protein
MGSQNGQYPTLKRPATLDHLDAKPKPWRIVTVCTSNDALDALADAQAALGQAHLAAERADASDADMDAVEKAQQALDKAQAAVDKATYELLFVSVGRRRYKELIDEFTVAKDDGEPEIDGDALNVALVAASCHSPELTREAVQRFSDEWNAQEFDRLMSATLEVNTGSRLVELGKASRLTRLSAKS